MILDISSKEKFNIPFTQYIKHYTTSNSCIQCSNEKTTTIIQNTLNANTKTKTKNKQQHCFSLNHNFNSCSLSLNCQLDSTSAVVNIYGPSEAKSKQKIKSETAFIDVITTFNYDISKEKQRELTLFLKNFAVSVIKSDEYPRCFITIVINIIHFHSEIILKNDIINSLMLAFSLSGIDLKVFALSTLVELPSNNKVKIPEEGRVLLEDNKMDVEDSKGDKGDNNATVNKNSSEALSQNIFPGNNNETNNMLLENENIAFNSIKNINNHKYCLIILDVNEPNNILNIESTFPLEINSFGEVMESSQKQISYSYNKFRKELLRLRE